MSKLQRKSALPEIIIGNKYGMLTVIRSSGQCRPWSKNDYDCLCDCGNATQANKMQLLPGTGVSKQSCGCATYAFTSKANTIRTPQYKRIFSIWLHMKDRCYNLKCDHYYNYGGRGISICNEWVSSFEAFLKWSLENGYSAKLTIDRIDVNGNYEPANCRWATVKEQINNTRINRIVTYLDKEYTMQMFSEMIKHPYGSVRNKLNRGWTTEEIANTPLGKRRKIAKRGLDGKFINGSQLA